MLFNNENSDQVRFLPSKLNVNVQAIMRKKTFLKFRFMALIKSTFVDHVYKYFY